MDHPWNYDERSTKPLENFMTAVNKRALTDSNTNNFQRLFSNKISIELPKDGPEDNTDDVIIIMDDNEKDKEQEQESVAENSINNEITNNNDEVEAVMENLKEMIESDNIDDQYFLQIIKTSNFSMICAGLSAALSAGAIYKLCVYVFDKLKEISAADVKAILSLFILPYVRFKTRTRYIDSIITLLIAQHPVNIVRHIVIPLLFEERSSDVVSFIISKLDVNYKKMVLDLYLKYIKNSVPDWVLPILIVIISGISNSELNANQLVAFLEMISKNLQKNTAFERLYFVVADKLKNSDSSILNSLKAIAQKNYLNTNSKL